MNPNISTTTALDRLLAPLGDALNVEAARRIADLRIDEVTQARIEDLAGRNTEGRLTDEERAEYASYVDGLGLINVLKSKARRRLADGPIAG